MRQRISSIECQAAEVEGDRDEAAKTQDDSEDAEESLPYAAGGSPANEEAEFELVHDAAGESRPRMRKPKLIERRHKGR